MCLLHELVSKNLVFVAKEREGNDKYDIYRYLMKQTLIFVLFDEESK